MTDIDEKLSVTESLVELLRNGHTLVLAWDGEAYRMCAVKPRGDKRLPLPSELVRKGLPNTQDHRITTVSGETLPDAMAGVVLLADLPF